MSSLHGFQLHAPVGWIADKTSVPETYTHQQIRLAQLSPLNEGEGRHRSRFSGPCDKVCSDGETLNRELKRIATAVEGNGYPKQFTEKAISRQLKRPAMKNLKG